MRRTVALRLGRRLIAVALICSCSWPAYAVKEIAQPAAMKIAFAKNLAVLNGAKFFEGPGNLIGVVTFYPNHDKPAVLYVSPDGRVVFLGMAVDTVTNKNLTAEAASQFAPGSALAISGEKAAYVGAPGGAITNGTLAAGVAPQPGPDDPVPTAMATPAALAQLAYIETGSGDRIVYAFVDPLCKYCQTAHTEISGWQKAGGRTRVRWVPVSLGNEQSTLRAAQALGERSPVALTAMFKGSPIVQSLIAKGGLPLDTNLQFIASALPIHATPVFVYVDGGKVVAKTGFGGLAGLSGKGL